MGRESVFCAAIRMHLTGRLRPKSSKAHEPKSSPKKKASSPKRVGNFGLFLGELLFISMLGKQSSRRRKVPGVPGGAQRDCAGQIRFCIFAQRSCELLQRSCKTPQRRCGTSQRRCGTSQRSCEARQRPGKTRIASGKRAQRAGHGMQRPGEIGNPTNYLDLNAATNVPAWYYRVRLVR